MMSTQRKRAYGGYYAATVPSKTDSELMETGSYTAAGKYLRKFWHPICLSSELETPPLLVRHLGEDLIVFKNKKGHVQAELKSPNEVPTPNLELTSQTVSYPTHEHLGIVFAYLGPARLKPRFPIYDSYNQANDTLIPYSIWHSCNWLHVQENIMDPAHVVFLHSRNSQYQLSPQMGVMPATEFRETDNGNGCLYVTTRRLKNLVWVRCIHALLPGFFQAGALFEQGDTERYYTGAALTRWTVPIDNEHCRIFGYRHFSKELDPNGAGKPQNCGKELVDFAPGQTMHRNYEEMQRNPGDWEVLVSQGPLPDHGRENMGWTDTGVMMLRRQFRRALRNKSPVDLHLPQKGGNERVTYTFDAILNLPPSTKNDKYFISEIGRRTTDIVLECEDPPGRGRDLKIRRRIEGLKQSLLSELFSK